MGSKLNISAPRSYSIFSFNYLCLSIIKPVFSFSVCSLLRSMKHVFFFCCRFYIIRLLTLVVCVPPSLEPSYTNTFKYHVFCTDGKISVRINLPLFSTVVPAIICMFLSCRPFVVIKTLSTVLVGVEVTSVSCLGQLTVGV